MGDYKEVAKGIRHLESLIPGGLFGSGTADWKAVWAKITEIGSNFKGARFPTKDDHEAHWQKFQALVARVKQLQGDQRAQWESKKRESESLRNEIVAYARAAAPPSGFADLIVTIATGGMNLALNALMGPFDERKADLKRASDALQEGWGKLHHYKDRMLGQHKQEAFQALNAAKEKLDHAWGVYKRERDRTFAEHQQEREGKREQWIYKMQAHISDLDSRRDRLTDILSKREAHLATLYDKLSDARSDDYRDRVSGWIEEEKTNIEGIREKLGKIEEWLRESREKLAS